MATKIRKLLDENGNDISPVTSSKAVINERGENLDNLINRKVGFKDAPGNPKIPGKIIDLSKVDIFGDEKDTRETANCYVISKPGVYCFPLIYGCGIKNGTANIESYTNLEGQYQADFVNYKGNQITSPYIKVDTGENINRAEILISDEETGIKNLYLDSGYVKFTVTEIPETGANYVIGIKDSNGNIMWSWHIWLWNQVNHPLEEVQIINYSGNTYTILNYNLATKLDSDLTHMKNWFYQWGRKDPMLCSENYNSNTVITSYGSTSFNINNGPASSVDVAIKNPCTFYTYGGTDTYHYNWTQLPSNFYNFWDATCGSTGFNEKVITKTIYDPCPPGYSIPNARVFTGFTTTGDWGNYSQGQVNVSGSWNSGWNFLTASGGSVFFPASGCRNLSNGSFYNLSSNGYCWSAGAGNEYYATQLYFSSDSVFPLDSSSRAYGFSVRPCAY